MASDCQSVAVVGVTHRLIAVQWFLTKGLLTPLLSCRRLVSPGVGLLPLFFFFSPLFFIFFLLKQPY